MFATRLWRVTLVLLSAAMVVSALLAYRAHRDSQSRRDTLRRAAREYAALAAWDIATSLRQQLMSAHVALFARASASLEDAVRPHGGPFPITSDSLATMFAARQQACQCLPDIGVTFVLDASEVEPDASRAIPHWVRDSLEHLLRPRHGRLDATPSGPPPIARSVAGFGRSLILDPRDAEEAALILLARTADGRAVAAFGATVATKAFLAAQLDSVLDRPWRVPLRMARGLATDSIVSVRMSDATGRTLTQRGMRVDARYAAEAALDADMGSLRLDVSLNPAVVERALPGASAEARLPVPLVLFVISAGMIATAIAQLRRHRELVRIRTDFVSGVSHELRTPLTQIRLLAELLHSGKLTEPERSLRAARVIDHESRRLTYMVENILAFSRAERHATRLDPRPLDVCTEISDIVDTFAPLAAARRSRIELAVAPGSFVRVDAGAIRQILLNLLDNANRYGAAGQTITVGLDGGTTVHLWVEDQGPGVPSSERDRIWLPYYRVERDSRSVPGGTGIGLAVVRDLVTRHGGRVWVEDGRRGAGARFVVALPSAEPDAA